MKSQKPPILKEPKVMISLTVSKETKRLLQKAAKTTRLSQGEYVERALGPQFIADHIK
jgi:uncharacterized protein (DUF1778 family)